MREASVEILVSANDRETCDAISSHLRQSDHEALVVEKRGLDGGVAEWILSASVALGGAKPFLDFLLEYVKAKRVGSVTWRDLTIENPRPEDVEHLKRLADERQ